MSNNHADAWAGLYDGRYMASGSGFKGYSDFAEKWLPEEGWEDMNGDAPLLGDIPLVEVDDDGYLKWCNEAMPDVLAWMLTVFPEALRVLKCGIEDPLKLLGEAVWQSPIPKGDKAPDIWIHKKSGRRYVLVNWATNKTTGDQDGKRLVVYYDVATFEMYARDRDEFHEKFDPTEGPTADALAANEEPTALESAPQGEHGDSLPVSQSEAENRESTEP